MTEAHDGQATGLTTNQIADMGRRARQDVGTTERDERSQPDGPDTSVGAPADAGARSKDAAGSQPREQPVQLLETDELKATLERWRQIQGEFVDEPRQAIDDADALVADLMQRLASSFAREREQLDAQLRAGSDVSTEDMRQGLQRYRSFFERLLAA